MDAQRAADELKVIRQLMERPVRYSTMSGLSGILAGCVTLLGLATDAIIYRFTGPETVMWINVIIWAMIFVLAVAGTLGLTRMREVRQGMPFWSPIKRRILMTLLPPFVAGAGLTVIIIARWFLDVPHAEFQPGLIAPLWMLFYGVACWQVGEFSIPEIRLLGAAFVVFGLICAAFFQTEIFGYLRGLAYYVTLGVSFGMFHIVYGLRVWAKYGG
jgi:hypothetical protein